MQMLYRSIGILCLPFLLSFCYKASKDADQSKNGNSSTGAVQTLPAPTLTIPGGTYNQPQNLRINSSTPDALICYTISPAGTDPACNSNPSCVIGNQLLPGFSVQVQTGILRSITCKAGYSASAVASATYSFDNVPPGNATSFTANPGNAQVFLSWNNPGTDFSSVRVMRKTGSNPISISDGTLVYSGNASSYTDTSVVNLTAYYYTVFVSDAAGNYASGISANATPVNGPPGNVSLSGVSSQSGKVNFVWVNPSDSDFLGVKILRKTTGYPANSSDGTVIYNSNGTSFSDTGVTNGISYYYGFFAYDTASNYAAGVTASGNPYLAPATSFSALSGNQQVSLSWFNSTTTNSTGVKILRKAGSSPTGPTDGTVVYNAAGTPGAYTSFTDLSLANGTIYYYAAYAYDATPVYAPVSSASAFPSVANVSGFGITGGYNQLSLTWTNPVAGNFAGVKILRKTGGYPISPVDGSVVYNGSGTSYADTNLVSGTVYYYRAFAYDTGTAYAAGTPQTGTTIAVPNVTTLTGTPGIYQITLSWTNTATANFSGVTVLRKAGSFPTGPADGTVIYNGNGTSVIDTGLASGVIQYYRAFAYDAFAAYSSGASLTANATNVDEVTSYAATPGSTQITLNWVNPTGANFVGVKIVKKMYSCPTSTTDGTTILTGTGTTVTDTGLTNYAPYCYRAFTYDSTPVYSTGISITATPASQKEIIPGWDKTFNSNLMYLSDLKTDSQGNVYVTGMGVNIVSPTSSGDWVIKKFNSAGVEDTVNWDKKFEFSPGGSEQGYTLAIDSADNVYAAGWVGGLGDCYWWIKKFNSAGVEDTSGWNKTFVSGTNGGYAPSSMVVDHNDNIYVAGRMMNGIYLDGRIKKFTAAGVEDTVNWDKKIFYRPYYAQVLALAVDSGNNLYSVGYGENLVNGSSYSDWWIRKFDANGTEDTINWNKKYDWTTSDNAQSVTVDSADNVYVSGGYSSSGWRIKKFNSSGSENTINWNKDLVGFGTIIAVSGTGNVVSAAARQNYVGMSTDYDWSLKKYTSNGVEDTVDWDRKFDFASASDQPKAIAFDPAGNVYVAGVTSAYGRIKKFNP